MNLTKAQEQAVAGRGNVLVMAGAGTGKTRTLVERCLRCLINEQPAASVDELLVVTFTEAAAAEVRRRIRDRLEQEAARQPRALRWHEQLGLFEEAHIGTLHGFCLKLVRRHFHELGLDPQLTVLSDDEAHLLAGDVLDTVLQRHYRTGGESAEALKQLVRGGGRGWDEPVRQLVLKVHDYTQTRPDPDAWFRQQEELFGSAEPVQWREWLARAAAAWRETAVEWLNSLPGNKAATSSAAILKALPPQFASAELAAALRHIAEPGGRPPVAWKPASLKPLREFFEDVAFLASLVGDATTDALAEDWRWVRPQMQSLLQLAREFGQTLASTKRELGALDFHDLEQHALRVLWDSSSGEPTAAARQWQQKLRFVFVDEYQDINTAQDKIIAALSRGGVEANRFLVGDVKQSIYRFRLANPRIFQSYATAWGQGGGQTVALNENFRSAEAILVFANSLFAQLMQPELGGVAYDEDARLRAGAPGDRSQLAQPGSAPAVELHVRVAPRTGADPHDEAGAALAGVGDLEATDQEARLVAARLREIKHESGVVWDSAARLMRPAEWRDMAVLLRSPAGKVEAYARQFSALGIPLEVARGGFYDSLEIADLIALLQLLDNPLQDIPAISVLRSPLVGLSINELAAVRLASPATRFWVALRQWHGAARSTANGPGAPAETWDKVDLFLRQFGRWRRLARRASLSRCLEAVLAETQYAAWVLAQPRGEQRYANVQRLLELAEQFDRSQRMGLFRFLRFVETQRAAETDMEVPAAAGTNAVRLMSIHQSKGLEFPVVVVADLGKPFNLSDLNADVILDETHGLCPQVKPPRSGTRYPSLPYWIARRRQKLDMLGEELRLLYVAVTRAQDRLVLTANVGEKRFADAWTSAPNASAVAARSFSDWIGFWFAKNCAPVSPGQSSGKTEFLTWTLYHNPPPAPVPQSPTAAEPQCAAAIDWEQLRRRVTSVYPYAGATFRPAKNSVSALRRQAMREEESGMPLFHPARPGRDSPDANSAGDGGVEIGKAHHRFLEYCSLDRLGGVEQCANEAARLQRERWLSAREVALLDFRALAAFGQSELGARLRAHSAHVRRELEFTARFTAPELLVLTGGKPDAALEGEFVVVQGVADLVVMLPRELWLVDFKTDSVSAEGIPAKVGAYLPQIILYARALSRIYSRPVTGAWIYFLSIGRAIAVPIAGVDVEGVSQTI